MGLNSVTNQGPVVVYYKSRKLEIPNDEEERSRHDGCLLCMVLLLVYYESIKRKLKTKYIWGCWCYERLQPNTKEFTLLTYNELVLELEHLKIETRLITEMFVNVMGECENEIR
jgi:hypothetical protein